MTKKNNKKNTSPLKKELSFTTTTTTSDNNTLHKANHHHRYSLRDTISTTTTSLNNNNQQQQQINSTTIKKRKNIKSVELNNKMNDQHSDNEINHLLNNNQQQQQENYNNSEEESVEEEVNQNVNNKHGNHHHNREPSIEPLIEIPTYLKEEEELLTGDYEKFVYKIPISFDNFFRSFDDNLIKIIQFKNNKFTFILSLIITFFTTIELGIITPFILFILGLDSFGNIVLWNMLILSILSQIPKRFLFRMRPNIAKRAKMIAKDKTSSFPSRAVTCSVVYSFFICYFFKFHFYNDINLNISFWFWCLPIIFISAIITSLGRIHLGVHYPSDCIFGILQGFLVLFLGMTTYFFTLLVCPTCGHSICYADKENSIFLEIGNLNFGQVNWILFILLTIFFIIVGVLFVLKPIQFYTKFHHVFSLLIPCVTFQFCFLCPELSMNRNVTIRKPLNSPQWYSYLYAFIISIVITIIGMKSPKKYSIIAFIVLYFIVFCALFFWRVGIL